MYLGRLVELSEKSELFALPRHPYTRIAAGRDPDIHMSGRARTPVHGEVPNPLKPAERLHLSSALPARERALQGGTPRAPADSGRADRLHAVEEGRI